MSKKGFNLRDDNVDEQIKKQREERAAKMESESVERMGISDGPNVFWVVPPMGEMLEPVVDMLIHYRPYHRCGREDPVPDASEEGGYKKDKSFSNCIRCQTAWDTWDGAGRPEGPAKRKFGNDMENHQAIFQAFDFTPFFNLGAKGKWAKADAKLIKAHLGTYLEIAAVEEYEERKALGKQHKEDGVPEDIVDAAVLSPGLPHTNSEVGAAIRDAIDEKYMTDEVDPTGHPDQYLIQVIRTNDGGTFTGADGKERNKKKYSVKFVPSKVLKAWTKAVDKDELIEVALERCQDIYNLEPASDSLEDRARALEKLNDDEIEQLLKEAGHSYDYRDEFDDAEDVDDAFDPDEFDPDAEDGDDDDVLSTEDHAKAEELKKQLAEEG